MRQRGIEPRSTAWKATMLTITPLTLAICSMQIGFKSFRDFSIDYQLQRQEQNLEATKENDEQKTSRGFYSITGKLKIQKFLLVQLSGTCLYSS